MKTPFVRISLVGLLATFAATLFCVHSLRAQNGINSDGTDFFVGFMPGIISSQGSAGVYFLIGSYQNNNSVTIEYINGPNSSSKRQYILSQGLCSEIPIDPSGIVPERPGEVLEYKSAHIYSKYPISVQVYSEGSNNGSMYQAIPTAALGKSYVVAAYNDNPSADAQDIYSHDSSRSEFEIIAAYDNTNVTITPNSTTIDGITGVNSGPASNGSPHPFTINMQRGQTYWVRSSCDDANQDESGSTIIADKPIAVLGGQERAMFGYSPYGTSLDVDIRDQIGEEMTPSVDWGTDYPSIPSMPASSTQVNYEGNGDLYRIFSNDPNGMGMDYWESIAPSLIYGPNAVNRYGTTQFESITDPIDMVTDPNSVDTSGTLKKFYAVQYMYFQGQIGGADPRGETTYRAENEMNLVPIDHWRRSAIFMVPQNSNYSGYQFINVITYRDSLRTIYLTHNDTEIGSIGFFTPTKRYQIPQHPELVGLTIKMRPGSYMIHGNTPFECYSYGRTETQYKNVFGYAAPCGESFGSHLQSNPPKADITPSCGMWNVRVHEGGTGGGIADVLLLDDSNGYYVEPPQVSYNCNLIGTGTNPQNLMSPPFMVGDTNMDFFVQVLDPEMPAYAAIAAVDLSGNDTVIQLRYTPPAFTLSTAKVRLRDTLVGAQECSSFTLHVTSVGSASNVLVVDSNLLRDLFTVTTKPPLPAQLKSGDSIVFDVCYTPQDTDLHLDSIKVTADCIDTIISIKGKGLTPIIFAGDFNFGNVPVGDTICHTVFIRNMGDAPLIISSGLLADTIEFSFGAMLLPDTLVPGTTIQLELCFHPHSTGGAMTSIKWLTNLRPPFEHDLKDTSVLEGFGIESGVNSSPSTPPFTLSIVPNPASSNAMISLTDAPSANVEIFDVLGREVASFRVEGNYKWQMGSLPVGTYIVRAESGGRVISKRLLKQ